MKISLCLSGGGIKGAAHIGVLKALEERKIKVESISGTSSGSIISVLYSSGYKSEEIYKIFKKYCKKIKYFDYINIFKLIIGLLFKGKIVIKGLNSGSIIEKLINKECNKKNIYDISQLNKMVVIPTVNMDNGEVICFTSKMKRNDFVDNTRFIYGGNIGKVVRASCSYPVIFSPCKFKEYELLDGGIRENIPWKELKLLGYENIVNVVFEDNKDECCKNLIEVAKRSFNLLCRELSNYEILGAKKTIKIKTNKIKLLDMKKIDYLYELGYKKTIEFLDNNK